MPMAFLKYKFFNAKKCAQYSKSYCCTYFNVLKEIIRFKNCCV